MNDATHLLDYELRRNHTTSPSAEDRARTDLLSARRQDRRHRLAERVRSIANRLDA